ncbi:MAG: GNAT family N-acetyltransferase [Planctomycetota bacterium]|jgi:putative acetyltransferase
MIFREEKPEDVAQIRRLNDLAFGETGEGELVDKLRQREAITLSMVAEDKGKILGHILFTNVAIRNNEAEFTALGIGPMAVLPQYQRKGIGSGLMEAAIEKCRELGHEIVVVLGHPEFYPRFGFVTSAPLGIRCQFDAPEEAFMVLELCENALRGRCGVVSYRDEFNEL